MDQDERRRLAEQALEGSAHGPDASQEAARRAEARLATAESVILVEGISDQLAIEAVATRRGRDLAGEGVVVLPIGGAQAVARYVRDLGPTGRDLDLAGLFDADAVDDVITALQGPHFDQPETTQDLASLGFHICIDDLEDELIRAVGAEVVQDVLESQGDLRSFRTMQKQPQWRGRPVDEQLHRFFGAGARRSLRYSRLLISAADSNRLPPPLDAVISQV